MFENIHINTDIHSVRVQNETDKQICRKRQPALFLHPFYNLIKTGEPLRTLWFLAFICESFGRGDPPHPSHLPERGQTLYGMNSGNCLYKLKFRPGRAERSDRKASFLRKRTQPSGHCWQAFWRLLCACPCWWAPPSRGSPTLPAPV